MLPDERLEQAGGEGAALGIRLCTSAQGRSLPQPGDGYIYRQTELRKAPNLE